MITDKKKIVFFLGAGFSCAAGAPNQKNLLAKVLKYNGEDYDNPMHEYVKQIREFLQDAFSQREDTMKYLSLEDVYTPLDKCITDGQSFRGYSVNYIREILNKLSLMISIVIDWDLSVSDKDQSYLDSFVKKILDHKMDVPTTDHFSIVTTNWDILLDSRIYKQLRTENYNGAIDYGTHITSHSEKKEEQLIPPLVALTKGKFTIKLIKIHGSLNWLKCPSCNRMFVNPVKKIGIPEYSLDHTCRFCKKNYNIPDPEGYGISLEPQIIYPTFLKNLSHLHFARIWETAAIELSEASEIVFIGYSFPQADFEIRQLLARKVPDNCKITVIQYGNHHGTKMRYKNFFGKREFLYETYGVKQYVETEMTLN